MIFNFYHDDSRTWILSFDLIFMYRAVLSSPINAHLCYFSCIFRALCHSILNIQCFTRIFVFLSNSEYLVIHMNLEIGQLINFYL